MCPYCHLYQTGYLFPEIGKLEVENMQKYPKAKIIKLGVGDISEHILDVITSVMVKHALDLSTFGCYRGYGPEQGYMELRQAIADTFYRGMNINCEEIFISDGAQCEIFRVQALKAVISYYHENAKIFLESFNSVGLKVYGGENAPYVWVHFPGFRSWDIFAEILEKAHMLTIPGSRFGPGGEGFIRICSFGHRGTILEASRRMKNLFK